MCPLCDGKGVASKECQTCGGHSRVFSPAVTLVVLQEEIDAALASFSGSAGSSGGRAGADKYTAKFLALDVTSVRDSDVAKVLLECKALYRADLATIESEHQQRMSAVGVEYVGELDQRIKAAQQEGDLRTYKSLAAEKKRFGIQKTLPGGVLADRVGPVEEEKRNEINELDETYSTCLNRVLIALMKADKISAAELVDREIRAVSR